MSIGALGGRDEPSQEELMERQQEMQDEQSERQAARQLAQSAALNDEGPDTGYWDVIGDPDIESSVPEWDDHLDDFLSVEMSSQFATGNLRREDWESFNWRTEQEFWVAKNEFRDRDCGLDDVDMLAMYGEKKARMSDKMARRLRHAMQVKKMMTSLSVDARGLKSGTEIHTVARTEDSAPEADETGGWLTGVRDKLV